MRSVPTSVGHGRPPWEALGGGGGWEGRRATHKHCRLAEKDSGGVRFPWEEETQRGSSFT